MFGQEIVKKLDNLVLLNINDLLKDHLNRKHSNIRYETGLIDETLLKIENDEIISIDLIIFTLRNSIVSNKNDKIYLIDGFQHNIEPANIWPDLNKSFEILKILFINKNANTLNPIAKYFEKNNMLIEVDIS